MDLFDKSLMNEHARSQKITLYEINRLDKTQCRKEFISFCEGGRPVKPNLVLDSVSL